MPHSNPYYGRERDSSDSGFSEYSAYSMSTSTVPTVYSDFFQAKPTVDLDGLVEYGCDLDEQGCPRLDRHGSAASIETYASTAPSEAEDPAEEYQPIPQPEVYTSSSNPAYPREFADLFPSGKRLCIRHDDCEDGSMNLRVDTPVLMDGRQTDLTLFYLRMYDLKSRDFALRRYGRMSGSELCSTRRKYTKPASGKTSALTRSMVNAISSLKSRSNGKSLAEAPSPFTLQRTDSGYSSMSDAGEGNNTQSPRRSLPRPTNTTRLDFSNYAHVELKRRGAKPSKRYEYGYWGKTYTWKVTVNKNSPEREVSYHLYAKHSSTPIAHILPNPLSPSEVAVEAAEGGWVPPCSMWISDESTLSAAADVAETIIATGLLVLVDDTIKRKLKRKDRVTLHLRANEPIDPKQLLDSMFGPDRQTPFMNNQTPLRQQTIEA